MLKIAQPLNRPLGWISLSFCLNYLVMAAFIHGAALARPNPGLVSTAMKVLEDDEHYMRFFNQTWFGKALFRVLSPMFGFAYGEVIYLLFITGVSIATAWCFYRLCLNATKISSKFDEVIAIVVGVAWVALSRKIVSVTLGIYGLFTGTDGLFSIARTLVVPAGTYFTRFYQPGLSLFALTLGVLALEKARNSPVSTRALAFPVLALLLSSWILSMYPWFALTFLAYGGFQLLSHYRSKPFLIAALPAGALLAGLLLMGFGNPPRDYLDLRLPVERTRMLYWQFLAPTAALATAAIPVWRFQLGRIAFFLLVSQFLATLSNVVTGFVIAPDHFYLATPLPFALLVFSYAKRWERYHRQFLIGLTAVLAFFALSQHLNWIKSWFALVTGWPGFAYAGVTTLISLWAAFTLSRLLWKPSAQPSTLAPFAWPWIALLAIAGLSQHSTLFRRDFHLVSEKTVQHTERAQRECGRPGQPQYFFTTHLTDYWTIVGRSICQNVIFSGWELDLPNEDIASRYLAAMIHFKVFRDRLDALENWELHLKNLESAARQFSRNHLFYTDEDRFYQHLSWYLLFAGLGDAKRPEQMRRLFHSVDFEPALREIERLDREGQILVLDTSRPDPAKARGNQDAPLWDTRR